MQGTVQLVVLAGGALEWWSCGGAVELRWRAATPGLAAAAAGGEEDGDWGIEVPGLPHDGSCLLLFIFDLNHHFAAWSLHFFSSSTRSSLLFSVLALAH